MFTWPTISQHSSLAAMVNFEFSGDEIYDGLELQWYDDDTHGTGMLAFATRRDTGFVDYYLQDGVRPPAAIKQLGDGVGVWQTTDFDESLLKVDEFGVRAAAAFNDADGRQIEVRVDDRGGRVRRSGGLLAPVSDAISAPTSLLLVWLPHFDLVRTSGSVVARVDGRDLSLGQLPVQRLWRRRLLKYAAPVEVIEVFPDASAKAVDDFGASDVELRFDPPLPDLNDLAAGELRSGVWSMPVTAGCLTGGTWFAQHKPSTDGDLIEVGLDVTDRWQPGPMPLLMQLVTRAIPVFRRWPTTYRYRATLRPDGTCEAAWQRLGRAGADNYRKATGT